MGEPRRYYIPVQYQSGATYRVEVGRERWLVWREEMGRRKQTLANIARKERSKYVRFVFLNKDHEDIMAQQAIWDQLVGDGNDDREQT